jgi:hypothetical protein
MFRKERPEFRLALSSPKFAASSMETLLLTAIPWVILVDLSP